MASPRVCEQALAVMLVQVKRLGEDSPLSILDVETLRRVFVPSGLQPVLTYRLLSKFEETREIVQPQLVLVYPSGTQRYLNVAPWLLSCDLCGEDGRWLRHTEVELVLHSSRVFRRTVFSNENEEQEHSSFGVVVYFFVKDSVNVNVLVFLWEISHFVESANLDEPNAHLLLSKLVGRAAVVASSWLNLLVAVFTVRMVRTWTGEELMVRLWDKIDGLVQQPGQSAADLAATLNQLYNMINPATVEAIRLKRFKRAMTSK
eukprot:m51a1_g1526 hypothetical protein (260) ;mRNA; f:476800-486236